MDSINVVNLKIEKANAIKRFNRLRRIATLFRLVEILFMFIVISRFSFQIPVKFSLSGEYLRRIYSAVFSPRFVFIIGNAIVITLFLKSGWNLNSGLGLGAGPNQFSADVYTEYIENRVKQRTSYSNPGPNPTPNPNPNPNRCSTEFYTENIGNRVKRGNLNSGLDSDLGPGPNMNPNRNRPSSYFHTEYVENRVKQGNLNSDPNPNPNPSQFWADYETEYVEKRVKQGMKERKMSRSNSEDLRRDVPRRQLWRSETEVGRGSSVAAEEEEISGEEFRRRVEAFIARQQRSLREEEFP